MPWLNFFSLVCASVRKKAPALMGLLMETCIRYASILGFGFRPTTSSVCCRMILPQLAQTYKFVQSESNAGTTSFPFESQVKKPSATGVLPQTQIHASSLAGSCLMNSFAMFSLYHVHEFDEIPPAQEKARIL